MIIMLGTGNILLHQVDLLKNTALSNLFLLPDTTRIGFYPSCPPPKIYTKCEDENTNHGRGKEGCWTDKLGRLNLLGIL